jgi:hypothetical protein
MLKQTLLTSLLLLSTTTAHAFFGSDCPEAENTPKPSWVNEQFNYDEAGYRIGFGEARYHKNASYQDLRSEAEKIARAELTSSIKVEIKEEGQLKKLWEKDSQGESVKQRLDTSISTLSHIELPGLPIYKSWQDPESCTVYTLVRIDEPTLELVLQKTHLDDAYKKAQNQNLATKDRLFELEEAIRVAKKYQFSKLQGSKASEDYLRRFDHLKAKLTDLLTRYNNAVVVINKTQDTDLQALAPLSDTLKSSLSGSFILPKPCRSTALCMGQAQNEFSANYLSVASVSLNTVKQNGFWIGDFNVELVLRTLSDGKDHYKSGPLKVRVMNRHKHKLTLSKAMSKWMKVHNVKLEEFTQAAQTLN